jgi:hypothetical protein
MATQLMPLRAHSATRSPGASPSRRNAACQRPIRRAISATPTSAPRIAFEMAVQRVVGRSLVPGKELRDVGRHRIHSVWLYLPEEDGNHGQRSRSPANMQ